MVIGTAGHIDHGKTALVEALTGSNTDRLPEERRRGISIDLGYARIALGGGATASVVDVPGHERFIKNMVAGATGVDLFLLVVAADDGVMPQTREHLRILDILGVDRGVCALTKRDLVDDEMAELARMDVEELLAGRGIEVVEVSARTGEGVEAVRAQLASVIRELQPAAATAGPSRLWVDRAFSLAGAGTVVTGTLWSGTVELRQSLEALPSGERVRVRSLQVHGEPVERAQSGQRVAVGIPGVAPADLPRGTLLCTPGRLETTYRLDVELLDAELPEGSSVATVHHGTGEQRARVIRRGDVAQIRLTEAVAAVRGDRLVVRRNGETAGGARVVDPHPPRRVDEDRIRRYAEGAPEEIVGALLDAAPVPLSSEQLVRRGILSPADVQRGLAGARDLGGVFVTEQRFEALRAEVLERLQRQAAEFPLDPGLALEALPSLGGGRDRFLAAIDVERRENRVYAPGVRPTLDGYEVVIERLLGALAEGGSTPTALRELSGLDEREFRALARELERRGAVVFVRDGVGIAPDAYDRVRDALIATCRAEGVLTFAAFRAATGLSRRNADLLLAHFDSAGLTLRRGEDRVLRGERRGAAGSGGPIGLQNR